MVMMLFGILGAVFGSVANAVIYRAPLSLSWWKGKSICPSCKHELGWKDLVPIFSYLGLGGKCRYCRSPIASRYLFVELIMGIGFAVLSYQFSVNSLILMAILWVTVVIAAMDWETKLVSDWLVGIWFVLTMFNVQYSTFNIYGLLAGIGLIGGLWVGTKKKGMGEGDIGIAAVMGWWLGWPRVAPALWISFVAGAVYSSWLIVHRGKTMKSQVPFGPFLILGVWVAYIWGERIIGLVFR